MPRAKYSHINFFPKAYNFSQISRQNGEEIELDSLLCSDKTDEEVSEFGAEKMIISVLSALDDREKVIFLSQIIRGDGFRIDHLSLSQAMHISRQLYMMLLKRVRTKAKYILQDK